MTIQEIPGIDLQHLFLETGFSCNSYLMACSFPPLPICAPWNQSAACFTSWSSSTDLLHRTSGCKPRLAQYALSIPLLSYSFSLIKKDKGTLWYLSETGDAADPCSAQYSPVLPISVTQQIPSANSPPDTQLIWQRKPFCCKLVLHTGEISSLPYLVHLCR